MHVYHLNFIAHHGIKGQQWGKRNGPPYPLDDKDHSASEKKAGWKDSLNKEKAYSKEKRERNKSAVKEYYRLMREDKKPEYLAKEDYKKLKKKIEQDLKEKYPDVANRRAIAKKVAIGVGVAAVVAGTAYLTADTASYVHMIEVEADISSKFNSGKRAADVIASLMDKDVSLLSDSDESITAGTLLQRIIRDHNDIDKALSMEQAKDFVYATFDKNDNLIYQALLNSRGEGERIVTNRTLTNDLILPSAKKRATAFLDLLKDETFFKALSKDVLGELTPTDSKNVLRKMSPGQLYTLFNRIAGKADSASAPLYFGKIRDMGYNAIRDDNDSGYLGSFPVILLNASNDSVVSGHKAVWGMEAMINRLKTKTVPGFDRSTIYSHG